MQTEIERKFLVIGDIWRSQVIDAHVLRQGYIGNGVRIRTSGDQGWLTIKTGGSPLARTEYQYSIPFSDACHLLDTACNGQIVEKKRHIVHGSDGMCWEIDEFSRPANLLLAEIELTSADQHFVKPAWVGEEVTDNPAYGNAAIAQTITEPISPETEAP